MKLTSDQARALADQMNQLLEGRPFILLWHDGEGFQKMALVWNETQLKRLQEEAQSLEWGHRP